MGAGALFTDAKGDVLIVEPTYKDHWEVPGGIVETGETPIAACVRECREELGLELSIGRLLVVEHQTEVGPRGDSIMFIYDGGVVPDPSRIKLADDELKGFGFFPPDGLKARLVQRLARRVASAVEARATGTVIELENGVRRMMPPKTNGHSSG